MAKIKKEKIRKSTQDACDAAISLLASVRKKTRLIDKNKMRFACEMSEEFFDSLDLFVKRNTKKKK